uniref:Uncharacterized protein n=1 Tax=mine drainage metagenome TaxID=410659 RepID=E6PHX4_9ZZZZ
MVAHEPARETDQDRCKGRQPRSLCRLSDGRGCDLTAVVRCDHAAHCRVAIASDGNGHMSTPGHNARRENDGRAAHFRAPNRLFQRSVARETISRVLSGA